MVVTSAAQWKPVQRERERQELGLHVKNDWPLPLKSMRACVCVSMPGAGRAESKAR